MRRKMLAIRQIVEIVALCVVFIGAQILAGRTVDNVNPRRFSIGPDNEVSVHTSFDVENCVCFRTRRPRFYVIAKRQDVTVRVFACLVNGSVCPSTAWRNDPTRKGEYTALILNYCSAFREGI